MPRAIVVTSGKGGAGKTTVAANIGIALASKGESVVLVDLDVGLNNLDIALGLESNVLFDLSDCLAGKCRLGQALVAHPKCKDLYVLGCNNAESKIALENNIKRVIDKLKEHFDWVLIDSPAGIGSGFLCAIEYADEAIVVVTPHISSLRDSDKVLGILHNKKLNRIGVVVNRIRGDLVASNLMIGAKQIESALKEKIIGIVPDSDILCTKGSYGELDYNEKLVFSIIAQNIRNDEFKQYDYLSKYKGVFGSVRRMVKRKA